MRNNSRIEDKILRPDIKEEFKVKATIEDEKGKDFVVCFNGSVDDCRDWLDKISRTFQVIKYEILFINAEITML